MTDNNTIGVYSTRARTRIDALISDASLVRWTIRIDYTFWSTIWWLSHIVFNTPAICFAISFYTLRIRSTWSWITCIDRFRWHRHNVITTLKWISCLAWIATTYRTMINNFTASRNSTCVYAWVYTFLVNTRFCRRTFGAYNTFGSTRWW